MDCVPDVDTMDHAEGGSHEQRIPPSKRSSSPHQVPTSHPIQPQHSLQTLSEIFVIYDADGTVAGELVYLIRKWLGKGHCAACDITHGPKREKPEWKDLKATIGIPVRNIHRDEMDIELYNASKTFAFPNVIGRNSEGDHVLLMGPEELDECNGKVEVFNDRLRTIIVRNGFSLPASLLDDSNDICGIRQQPITASGDNDMYEMDQHAVPQFKE